MSSENHQEKKVCTLVYEKSGKRWVFGVPCWFFGASLLDGGGVVYADEARLIQPLLSSCRLIHQSPDVRRLEQSRL